MEEYNFRIWNSEAEDIEDWGEINPKAIKEFAIELKADTSKLDNILKLMPILHVEDIKYYDVNYLYKNILKRVGNINKNYLNKICNELDCEVVLQSENVRYNNKSSAVYVKNLIYVPVSVIEYILKGYRSNWNFYYHDFETYIEYRYDETYNKIRFIEVDFLEIKQNAIKYIESVYLILLFCQYENIRKDLFIFNTDKKIIYPVNN